VFHEKGSHVPAAELANQYHIHGSVEGQILAELGGNALRSDRLLYAAFLMSRLKAQGSAIDTKMTTGFLECRH
jgi:hypothetical protein